jgi:putative addiction module component (TIGR02574 family)
MQPVLPLEQMTRKEKLRIMEELWTDLSCNESQLESPAWHGDVLRERIEAVKAGKETFIDWEDVKKQLRDGKK